MRACTAGILGGLIAGAAVAAAMSEGRRRGLLHETLSERAQNWLDERFEMRDLVGESGTAAVEQGTHLAVSGAFGALYATLLRPCLRGMSTFWRGAGLGTAMYFIDVVKLAPRLGITRGEYKEVPSVIAQRYGMHLLFGLVTAIAVDALSDR